MVRNVWRCTVEILYIPASSFNHAGQSLTMWLFTSPAQVFPLSSLFIYLVATCCLPMDAHLKVIVHMITMMWFYAFNFIWEFHTCIQQNTILSITIYFLLLFLTWPPHNFMSLFLNKVQLVIGPSTCVSDYPLTQPPHSPITNSSLVWEGLWRSSFGWFDLA